MLGIIASVFAVKQERINADLVNVNVERTVDLVSQLVKVNSAITLRNDGSSAVKSFLVAVEPKKAAFLSFIGGVGLPCIFRTTCVLYKMYALLFLF